MILAAHHVRDAGVEVVDRDGEVVEHRPVGAGDHGIVEMDVLEARVAADHVVDDRRALVGHAQAHRAVGLGLAAEAAVGAVRELVRLDVLGGRVRAVGVAARRAAPASASRWRSERSVCRIGPSSQSSSSQRSASRICSTFSGVERSRSVSSMRSTSSPPCVAREQPVEQGGARAADVQRAGRRWSELSEPS